MPFPSNLLVAIDFHPDTRDGLETVLALAARLDAKVHLVHAFTLSEVTESELRSESLSDAEADRSRRLHELAAQHSASGRIGEVIVREGDPASVLVQVAEQLHADMIIVAPYHHGLQRFVRGSVAESVIRDAPCSVLVLRHSRPVGT